MLWVTRDGEAMSEKDVTRESKQLSKLLRHGATASRLAMDAAGWAKIDDVLRVLHMTRSALDRAVSENTKSRLQIDGDRIRACQGHSREAMPVTLEALEASWSPWRERTPLWHGTHVAALASIAREGILAIDRTHVHLAPALDSTVGKRAAVDVMLKVDPEALRAAGVGVFESPNGVILVRSVPAACIVDLTAMTHGARSAEPSLRAHFGW